MNNERIKIYLELEWLKVCYFTNCYVCTSIIYLTYEYSIVYDLLLSHQLSCSSFAFLKSILVKRTLFLAVLISTTFFTGVPRCSTCELHRQLCWQSCSLLRVALSAHIKKKESTIRKISTYQFGVLRLNVTRLIVVWLVTWALSSGSIAFLGNLRHLAIINRFLTFLINQLNRTLSDVIFEYFFRFGVA